MELGLRGAEAVDDRDRVGGDGGAGHEEVAPAAETAAGEVECQAPLLGGFGEEAWREAEGVVGGCEGGLYGGCEAGFALGAVGEGGEGAGQGCGAVGEGDGSLGRGLDGAGVGYHPG